VERKDKNVSNESNKSPGNFEADKPISIEQLKEKVLEQVRAAGVTEKDPSLFEILQSTGRLEMLLTIIPKAFDQVFFSWLKTIRHELEAYEAAALKGQQKAIARCVEELIVQSGQKQVSSSSWQIPLIWVAMSAFVGLSFGLILGLYLPPLRGKTSSSSPEPTYEVCDRSSMASGLPDKGPVLAVPIRLGAIAYTYKRDPRVHSA